MTWNKRRGIRAGINAEREAKVPDPLCYFRFFPSPSFPPHSFSLSVISPFAALPGSAHT